MTPDALVVMSKVSMTFGRARVRRCVIVCLREVKSFVALSVHTKMGFFKRSVNGKAIWSYYWTNPL